MALKIAVINVDLILRNATSVKAIREQIGKYRKTFQEEIQKEEEALRNANQELARQRTLLSAEAFAGKRREFEQRVTKVQRLVQERKLNLDRAQAGAMGKVQDVLNGIITKLSEDQGISLILRRDQTILAVKELEVTDQVLKRLDKQLPTVKVADLGK
ncbi:MAG: OmpH family outer membrane protein [Alphaproteobacteria bacterium]